MALVSFSKRDLDEYIDTLADYAGEGLTISRGDNNSNSSQNQAIALDGSSNDQN